MSLITSSYSYFVICKFVLKVLNYYYTIFYMYSNSRYFYSTLNLSLNYHKQKNAVSTCTTYLFHHLTFDNTCTKLKKMKGKSDTLQELQKDGRIFYTIFYYTVLIILGPVLIFFGSKIIVLDGILGLSSTASNVWSALVAVIALHIIVGMYIYRAYSEPGRPAKPDKID